MKSSPGMKGCFEGLIVPLVLAAGLQDGAAATNLMNTFTICKQQFATISHVKVSVFECKLNHG
jgi:hypothetical protein